MCGSAEAGQLDSVVGDASAYVPFSAAGAAGAGAESQGPVAHGPGRPALWRKARHARPTPSCEPRSSPQISADSADLHLTA